MQSALSLCQKEIKNVDDSDHVANSLNVIGKNFEIFCQAHFELIWCTSYQNILWTTAP